MSETKTNGATGSGSPAQPFSLEAEQAVLGSLLLDAQAIVTIAPLLGPSDFYIEGHRLIYAAISGLYERSEPVDFISVLAELEKGEHLTAAGGRGYLMSLAPSVPTSYHAPHYAGIVARLAVLRRLITAGQRIMAIGYDDGNEAQDAVERAESEVFAVAQRQGNHGFVVLKDALSLYLDHLDTVSQSDGTVVGVPTGLADLDRLLGGLQRSDLIIIAARPSVGKCLAPETPVLMADGSIRQARNVAQGHRVMGPDGRSRLVLATTTGEDEMFRIVPTKGDPWICNKAHVLTLVRNRTGRGGEIVDVPLADYLDPAVPMDRGKLKLLRVPVDWSEQPTFLPPYLAGLWLGDGHRWKPNITNKEPAIATYCQEVAPSMACECVPVPLPDAHTTELRFRWEDAAQRHRPGMNPVEQGFRKLMGEDGQKHITPDYLRNSRAVRLELLAGLLDTDGYVVHGCVELVTEYEALRDDVLYLCRSLGLAAYAKPKLATIKSLGFSGVYWRMFISGDFRDVPCRILKLPVRRKERSVLRTAFTVEPLGRGPYAGFMVDGDGRFLLGDFTVTHNSALALSICHNTALKYKSRVALFSLEMSAEQLVARLLCMEGRLDSARLRSGHLSEEEWGRVIAAAGTLAECPIYIDDSATLTPIDLRGKIRRLHQQEPVDLIVVDYLQLMYTKDRTENRVQEVSKISRDLKALARDLNVPVIALSQLSRGVEARASHIPMLSDLRETGAIEQDADVVLMLYRDAVYNPESDKQNTADIICAKNRNGPTDTIELFWDAVHTRFANLAYSGQ